MSQEPTTDSPKNDGWVEFTHKGKRWEFDADQLAEWNDVDQVFEFSDYHKLTNPTVKSVIRFIEGRNLAHDDSPMP